MARERLKAQDKHCGGHKQQSIFALGDMVCGETENIWLGKTRIKRKRRPSSFIMLETIPSRPMEFKQPIEPGVQRDIIGHIEVVFEAEGEESIIQTDIPSAENPISQ